ncbi:class I SAM-dependent methyltransferase [Alsobacter sp. SYSU BS001988]
MTQTDRNFSGSIAEVYDRLMVPLIFEPYAEDLARRVAALSPGAVLETAAGSGAVTRALAPKLGPDARYVVTDLNKPMLDRAQRRQEGDGRLTWIEANALSLPFEDASFDVVLCQFGAMFFGDRVAGYREARRLLKPGGRFIFNVWDRIEENDFALVVQDALGELYPDDPPRFMARTPHGYHDVDLIRRDVEAAGFSAVEITTLAQEGPADAPFTVATAFCQGTPLRGEIEARDPQGLDRATRAAAAALEKRFGSGPLSGPLKAHVIEAAT